MAVQHLFKLPFFLTFRLKFLLSFYFSIETSTLSLLFYWNFYFLFWDLYFLFTFLLRSLISLYFLLKSLLSLYLSIEISTFSVLSFEISTFSLLFYWNRCWFFPLLAALLAALQPAFSLPERANAGCNQTTRTKISKQQLCTAFHAALQPPVASFNENTCAKIWKKNHAQLLPPL